MRRPSVPPLALVVLGQVEALEAMLLSQRLDQPAERLDAKDAGSSLKRQDENLPAVYGLAVLRNARNPLKCGGPVLGRFTAKPLKLRAFV